MPSNTDYSGSGHAAYVRRICALRGPTPILQPNIGSMANDAILGRAVIERYTKKSVISDVSDVSDVPSISDVSDINTILYGGIHNDTVLNKIWIWNRTWNAIIPTLSPPNRPITSMALDSKRKRIVLFGGSNSATGQLFNDTWFWDGLSWSAGPVAPPNLTPRWATSMVYDAARDEIVLFGGFNNFIQFNETWILNNSGWIKRSPTRTPSVRYLASMAYDDANRQVILCGGTGQGGIRNDTWLWNGLDWTNVSLTNPIVTSGAMAYNVFTNQVVLFGGIDKNTSQTVNDTYIWNNSSNTWILQQLSIKPDIRTYPNMAYDRINKHIVLFGGIKLSGSLDDTWIWDGTNWIPQILTTKPSARYLAAMA